MAYNSMSEDNVTSAWTPDLFGPIFKEDSVTLKQALDLRNADEQINLMATFVPDEIIHRLDLSDKSSQSYQAVLLSLNISGLSTLFKRYIYDENRGSLALRTTLNNYIHIVIREIYCNGGDVLKFSAEGLLAAWKVCDGEFMSNVVRSAIVRAICIQNSVASLNDVNGISKVNIVISAGDVTFSVIGGDEARNFVITGSPIEELKRGKRISLPNDLVLSSSAWQHCAPSQYEYVIKDSYNVKIVKVLKRLDIKSPSILPNADAKLGYATTTARKSVIHSIKPSPRYVIHSTSVNEEAYPDVVIADTKEEIPITISAIAATNPSFGTQLRSYLTKAVIEQIGRGRSLEFLSGFRQITTISLDIIPDKYPNNELNVLVDKYFLLLYSIVTPYAGCINTVNLYDKNIFFCIVFGTLDRKDEEKLKTDETCKNAVICAMQILEMVKSIDELRGAFVGVSTGMAYCGVIGDVARKYYAIIGPPVDRATGLMVISYDKLSCDYDTVLRSHLSKDQFRSRGLRILGLLEKHYVYEYLGDTADGKDLDASFSLDYCYPILGRLQELEDFDDVLNEIGVASRDYSGFLIEGGERSGKSRLLDAFVTSVRNRRINPIKLSLHVTYAEKAYAVIHHVILQILEAEDCSTVEDRERVLLAKLGDVLALEDFCYLNIPMRVHFPLSDTYCSDSDRQRDAKAISIFETILKQLETKICILLDDIRHMDDMSWRFLSLALDNNNVVMAMTMLKSDSWDDLSHVQAEICKDKRLMRRTLLGLDPNLLPAFACQFLNVLAIPRELSRILRRRKDGHVGWCEILLILILQSDALDFIRISPNEAKRHDIVFPDGSLVTKLPVDLTPEELAPPLLWSQRTHLDVCVINERYAKISINDRDMRGLITEIHDRMNPHEQDFIRCAATLDTVFKHNVLQKMVPSAIIPHITKIVAEMFRMRILQCASLQRRVFHSEDLSLCILKKRRTFSDMHHLLSCHCHLSHATATGRSLSSYAHCRTMEFKVDLFRKIIYDIQSKQEKQEYHTRAARIFKQYARKCSSCDGGTFLRAPSKEISAQETRVQLPRASLIRRRIIIEDRNDKLMRRSTPSVGGTPSPRRRESIIAPRIPIMPTYLDDEEDEASKTVLRNEEIREHLVSKWWKFWKRPTSVAVEILKGPSHPVPLSLLDKFSHIDRRNCQCDGIISCLFWRLHQHIENSEETDEIVDFLMEYSAGLIQTAQPSYAIKLLSIAAEKNALIEMGEEANNTGNNITDRGIILILTGDAYYAMGNYAQSKKYYTMAIMLRSSLPRMNKAICYNIIASKIHCKLRGFPHHHSINKISGRLAIQKLELASYMRRLCITLMTENRLKAAKLFTLRSVKLGFPSVGSFLEKSEIYLAAVRVLRCTKDIELLRCIEKSMLIIIRTKLAWKDAEEMAMMANIYLATYHIRTLRGELEQAVNIGVEVLKISETLHLNNLTLVTMPSLIQIMIWTKRVNKAVDLMKQLFSAAEDDVDLSAKTWYYALSLELILDAGVILESYETSLNYYKKCIAYRPKSCTSRDPQSLCRLLTCLRIYQSRMGYAANDAIIYTYSAKEYTKDISDDDFSHIFSCGKGLECYLLMLLRCVNLKHSNGFLDLIQDVYIIIKCLDNVSSHAMVIKPYLYLLVSYFNIIRGRKSASRFYLRRAQKFATLQGNKLIEARIIQNKRTWTKQVYNNMARYWLEYIESSDFVAWQHICDFSIDVWSTILYPLQLPDSYL